MMIIGIQLNVILNFNSQLCLEFEITNLGRVKFFLSLEVSIDEKGLLLCQKVYMEKLLKKILMSNWKLGSTPIVANAKFWKFKIEEKATDASVYRSLIKSLLYLTNTRTYIMYAASSPSRYMQLTK